MREFAVSSGGLSGETRSRLPLVCHVRGQRRPMMHHTSSRGLVLFLVLTVCPGALSDDCDQGQLIMCDYPMKWFTHSDELGIFTNKEELEKLCPQLKDGLKCIDDFTRRCMTPARRNYFNKLYAGTHSVIMELCENAPYQEEFLRHQPCMLAVREDYEKCAHGYQEKIQSAPRVGKEGESEGEGGGNEAPDSVEINEKYLRTVCCSFQAYLQCSKGIVLKTCGNETAKFTEKFLDRMAYPLIENHCEDYHVGSDKCKEFLVNPSSSYRLSLPPLLSLLLLSLLPLFLLPPSPST